MNWPGVSDYQEAVQAPQLCFRDAELRAGSPVLTKLGLPRPISGGNASVYQIRSGKNEFAVRCFLRDIPELRQRYAAIDRHLRASKLAAAVGFEYLPDGICVRGQWRPALKMQWVRGVPLNEHVGAIRGDAAALRALDRDWCALVEELERARIAHGDLQHGNVLVADGRLVLIDYDGMFVPELQGQPGLELGHPSFQHPQRQATDFGPAVDRFAALVIHTALLALAERPQLWDAHDNADNLLFTRTDFADPAASPLFAELRSIAAPDLQAALAALAAACTAPIGSVPRLAELHRAAPAATARTAAASTAAVVTPASGRAGGGGGGSRRGGKPQWLATLMAELPPLPTAALAAGRSAAAGASSIAFALTPVWQRDAAPPRGRRGPDRERRLVQAVLIALLHGGIAVVEASWLPWALGATVAAWSARHFVRARNRCGGGAVALTAEAVAVPAIGRTGIDLFDPVTGRRRSGIAGAAACRALAALAGGHFAVLGRDGALDLHAGNGAGAIRTLRRHVSAIAGSPSGDRLAVVSGGGFCVLDAQGRELGAVAALDHSVRAVAVDDRIAVAGSDDGALRIWSIADRKWVHVLGGGGGGAVLSVAISATGRFVAGGTADGRLLVFDAKRGKRLHDVAVGGALRALAFAPSGSELLVGADGMIHCFDAVDGASKGRVAAHGVAIAAIAVSADGGRVVSVDAAGNVQAWQRRVRTAAAAAAASAPKLQAAQP